MDRKQFFQLVVEAKNNIANYTPEQRARIYEKLDALSNKFMPKEVKLENKITQQNSDYLDEK